LDGFIVILSLGGDVNAWIAVKGDVRLKHLDHSCEVLVLLLGGYCQAEAFLFTAGNVAVIAAKKTRHNKFNRVRRWVGKVALLYVDVLVGLARLLGYLVVEALDDAWT
jgi:hypothetical protein